MRYLLNILNVLCVVLCWPHVLYAIDIAISIDDAPRGDEVFFSGEERTEALIATLARYQAEAAFFCNPSEFTPTMEARLRRYGAAGHMIANHTATHRDFHEDGLAFAAFAEEIQRADEKLRGLPGFQPFFRFPYLHQGQTEARRTEVNTLLKELGYRHGYVTVETYDWHLNRLLQDDARGNRAGLDLAKVREVYLKMLYDGILFYDDMAQKLLQRSPKHVLLLHENDLNALFLGDLLAFLQSKGHRIVSISSAYADDLADARYDELPYSQRRLRGLARHVGYNGALFSAWEEEKAITALYERVVH